MRNRILKTTSLLLVMTMVLPFLFNLGTVGAVATDPQTQDTIVGEKVKTPFDNLDLSLGRQNIDENWKFKLGDQAGAEATTYNDSDWENINLPHDYSLKTPYTTSGEAESGYKIGGIGWYRKTIRVDENLKGKRFIVDFGGVYMNSIVYINGQRLGMHPYGYTPFAYDLTDYLVTGENVLAVKVSQEFPSSRWYSGSGIYRSVHLTIANPVRVERYGVSITTPKIAEQFESRNIDTTVKATVINNDTAEKSVSVKFDIREKSTKNIKKTITTDAKTIANGEKLDFSSTLNVENITPWGLKNPFLYEVVTTVLVNGQKTDESINEFGYRTIRHDPNEGFFLNGEHIKLQGVSMHHDQGSLGAAAHYRAIERQVEKLQEMGVNAIRVTHNPAADSLVEIANRKGMLLIDEIFDTWVSAKNSNYNDFAKWFRTNIDENDKVYGKKSGEQTWAEFVTKQMVLRGQNAPSIIMWSTGNEVMEGNSGPYADYPNILTQIADWIQEVDTERGVTIGDNKFKAWWTESAKFGDIITSKGGSVGMNYSAGSHFDYYHQQYPNWSIYASETSSAINSRGIYKTENVIDRMFSSYDTKKVGWGHMSAESWLFIAERDFMAGEFIWTGFDYLGEPTNYNKVTPGAQGTWPSPKSSYFGIIDTAGLPKDRFYFYKSQWDKENTTLHILPAWKRDIVNIQANGNVRVNVYSNAKSVELFFTPSNSVEEKSLGKKTFDTVEKGNGFSYQIYRGEDKSTREYENLYLRWDVPYEDGTIRAVAYNAEGEVIQNTVGRNMVSTYGDASKLALTADRTQINADGKDLSYITIDVKDSNDNLVAGANNEVTVTVEGDGKLLALDNGDQRDHTPYENPTRRALSGQLVAIVQSTKGAGSFTVKANSEGLSEGTVTVTTTPVSSQVEENPTAYTAPQVYFVKAGTVAQLDNEITLHYDSKPETKVNVRWQPVDTSREGEFTVNGFVDNLGLTVKATVVVIDESASLLNYSTVTSVGSSEVQLPSGRPLVTRDGRILSINYPVQWSAQDISQYNNQGIYTVSGTANLFGNIKNITAKIRVTEGNTEISSNIAPNNLRLTQDIVENKQSDSLLAIVDGNKDAQTVAEGQANPSVWTNYKAAQEGDKDAIITFEFATAQNLSKATLHYYRDSWSARLPENVEIEYAANDLNSWRPILFNQVVGEERTPNGLSVTPIDYTFSPVSATAIRFKITAKAGKNDKNLAELCVGLSELELFTSTTRIEKNTTAQLDSLSINDKLVTEDLSTVREFISKDSDLNVVATGKDNAAVTILPEYNERVIVITESEDNQTRDRYTVFSKDYVELNIVDDASEYKIYPKPQEINYLENGTTLTNSINVVTESGIDKYTVDKVQKLLDLKGLSKETSDNINNTRFNILVGIKGSGGVVDTYFTNNVQLTDHFTEIDAYQLVIKDNIIAVLGKNSDAAFYGLTTLEHIFKQSEGKVIRQLTVNDFSSQEIRGVIEGYYGVPWTWERRKDIMKFGAEFKNNVMIFAPKDDPYHRDKWRDLYPQEELEKISELAKLGNETKNRFVWTIAPFHRTPINASNYDESLEILKQKLNQLYDAGVRQFGVLRDDISNTQNTASNYQVVSRLMRDLKVWADSKEEKIYDFLFCPYSYTLENWAWRAAELNEYTANFPENVKIFYTGKNVCAPVEQAANEQFMSRGIVDGQRRPKPLIWLNWPVNDVFKSSHGYMALVMGNPKSILNTDVNNMSGVVTNPMQESYASYVSVFAIADYTWNTSGYNADISYSDGFKFIDPNAYEELKELSSHMANVDGTIGIRNLPESQQMVTEITEFETAMNGKDLPLIKEKGKLLKDKYQAIISAVDGFNSKSTFTGLKEDLSAYIQVLKEKSEAAIKYIDSIIANKEDNLPLAQKLYSEAEALYDKSKTHEVQVSPNGEMRRADAGVSKIKPNIENMRVLSEKLIRGPLDGSDELIGDNIAIKVQGSTLPLAIASWTNDGPGSADRIQHINDGIKDYSGAQSNRWTNWTASKRAGDWVGILFGNGSTVESKNVSGIKLGFFQDHGTSMPQSYTIEYYDGPELTVPANPAHINSSNSPLKDDANWKEVTNLKTADFRLNDMNSVSFDTIETKAIRIKMTPKPNMGLAITEFEVYGEKIVTGPFDNPYITSDMVIFGPTRASIVEGNTPDKMIDANDSTYTSFELDGKKVNVGDCIGLDLNKAMRLGRFRFVLGGKENGNNFFSKYKIMYSKDGSKWIDFGEEISQDTPKKVNDLDLGGIEARYLLVRNLEEKASGLEISEFMVETEEIKVVVVNKEALKELVGKADTIKLAEYTDETSKALTDALNKAKLVLEDSGVNQEKVDTTVQELQKAIDALQLKPVNKEELIKLIEQVNKLVLSEYTDETSNLVKEKLDIANGIVKDDSAKQDAVDKALNDLQTAVNALVKKEVIKPDTPKYTGWKLVDGVEKYYIDGEFVKGLKLIGKTTYLFNANGEKQKGWHVVNGKACYFSPEHGGGMLTGMRKIGQTVYLLTSEGKQSGWHRINGKDYYFSPEHGGGMLTGIRKIGNISYLLTSEGKKFGWHRISGHDYYFSPENGVMYTGLRKVGNILYLFNTDGQKIDMIR